MPALLSGAWLQGKVILMTPPDDMFIWSSASCKTRQHHVGCIEQRRGGLDLRANTCWYVGNVISLLILLLVPRISS